MDRIKILKTLREILQKQLSLTTEEINETNDDSDILEEFVLDSLDKVELVMAVEDAFKITTDTPDEIAESWKTLDDVAKYLEQLDVVKSAS